MNMLITNRAIRSPSRTCVRSVTLTRADVLALATSLNCILSCLVDATGCFFDRKIIFRTQSFPKPLWIPPHAWRSRGQVADRAQTVDWLERATGGTDQWPRLAIVGPEIEGEVRGRGLGEWDSNPGDWRLQGCRSRASRMIGKIGEWSGFPPK